MIPLAAVTDGLPGVFFVLAVISLVCALHALVVARERGTAVGGAIVAGVLLAIAGLGAVAGL